MYLKSLTISSENKVIREIHFRKGINLIVDDSTNQITGNDVGKTTTLKLIDFCLGAKPSGIYADPKTKKDEYTLVKNFLKDQKIVITLILKQNLDVPDSKEIKIQRNFLQRSELIRQINGEDLTEDEFLEKLTSHIFPHHTADKPSFRQIISHNLRCDDDSITHTLRTLGDFASDAQYETLHLYLLGCDVETGNTKQELLTKIQQENVFKKRLEKNQTKTTHETTLALIEADIKKLNAKKATLNINENFESDLAKFNTTKYQISKLSSEISKLNIRKELILEARQELEANVSKIDTKQLLAIYQQATKNISGIQKTFEDLVQYHNQMLVEKIKFITQELPTLTNNLSSKNNDIKNLLQQEQTLALLISKSDTYEDLEKLIGELNEKFKKKGELETTIQQLLVVEEEIKKLQQSVNNIDSELFSDNFEQIVKQRKDKFNEFFAAISSDLYGEQYALNYNIITNKKNEKLYKFTTFNIEKPNLSSGKKQGEISCFDMAYICFADQQHIPCLHFILNDKKELMHDNQLVKIAQFANNSDIQFVASILKGKLPEELNKEEFFILKLSSTDKLFRID
jgi:uncharacterized protein YydD (DUF2326 family)